MNISDLMSMPSTVGYGETFSTTTAPNPATTTEVPPEDCPTYSSSDDSVIEMFSFWIEGVLQCCVAIGGLFGNLISGIILSKDEMRNAFNLLLISLLCFDSWYLFGSILENLRRNFNLATNVHVLLFPYLLYPAQSIAMSGSVFMTVGIALERYIAVHYPIDYSQSMNSKEAIRNRLIKYLIPVILLSVTFNLPKFMEAKVIYVPPRNINGTSGFMNNTATSMIPAISVTELRKNPNYAIYYNNWTRLVVLGIVPFLLLVFFNYKIYKDIKLRQDRRRQSMNQQVALNHQARRRQEDNLAVVFMGIVLVFLACHILRIFISLHEMVVIRHAMACARARKRSFPMWAIITTYFSHFFLVLNSSTNMIIYCALNSTFRESFVQMIRNLISRCRCFCQSKTTTNTIRNGRSTQIQEENHSIVANRPKLSETEELMDGEQQRVSGSRSVPPKSTVVHFKQGTENGNGPEVTIVYVEKESMVDNKAPENATVFPVNVTSPLITNGSTSSPDTTSNTISSPH